MSSVSLRLGIIMMILNSLITVTSLSHGVVSVTVVVVVTMIVTA